MSDMRPIRAPAAGSPPADAAAPELATLLLASARGDEQAFAALYDQTSSRVYGMVQRVVRDPAQAAEVTQDVYLQVWRKPPGSTPRWARCCPGC